MRFSGDVAATFAARIVLVGLGVISSVLTARYLGPGGRGILATVGALAGIGIQLGNLGLHASNTYLVSRDSGILGSLWANSCRTATALGCSLALIAAAGAAFMPGLLGDIGFSMLILGIAGMPFHLTTLFGLNLVIGTGRLALFNCLEIVFRTVGVAGLLACLVLFEGGVRSILALNLAVAMGGALAVRAVLRGLIQASGAPAPRADLVLFRSSVAYGAKAYAAALLAYLIVRSDMLLVNALRGTSDAGVYSIEIGRASCRERVYVLV